MVYGAMRDKAVSEMTGILFPLADRIILTAPGNSRAMPPEEIAAPGAIITHSVAGAVAQIRAAPPEAVVFIAGSLYLAGEAREQFHPKMLQ
jgi:dihydrofolate synthase / folylpolyglutamate synthase